MPTDPNNPYVDTPHPKTVRKAGWVYGCHSSILGNEPRGRTIMTYQQDGWTPDGRRRMVPVKSEFIPRKCGHDPQVGKPSDPQCSGCFNKTF